MFSKNKFQYLVSESGKTANQLSKETGINHTSLYRLMNGKSKDIKLSNAFKLADALGVDINEFREEEKKMTSELIPNQSPHFEMTQEDMMINILQTQKQMKEQIMANTDDVHYLKNIQPVNPSVTKVLEKKRRACVVKWLGGKDAPAYKQMHRQVFAEAGHDFKEMFDINRYDLLRKKDEETALMYWDNWEPATNTKMQINNLNNQMSLLEG